MGDGSVTALIGANGAGNTTLLRIVRGDLRPDSGGVVVDGRLGVMEQCSIAALGIPFDRAQYRPVRSLSGGEQKRLVLEALLRGPEHVLLLDEPDNYLDVPGKGCWIWSRQKPWRRGSPGSRVR